MSNPRDIYPDERMLTVVIRDESPLLIEEPCTYRTIRLGLTAEQIEALRLSKGEAIQRCFLEGALSPFVSPYIRITYYGPFDKDDPESQSDRTLWGSGVPRSSVYRFRADLG